MSEEKEIKEVEETTKVVEGKKDRKGLCIASMVLGIVSVVLFCIWYLALPCAIVAIVFGVLGLKSSAKGMAIAGLATGIIGLIISLFIIIAAFMYGFSTGLNNALNTNSRYDYNYYNYYDRY